MKSIKLFFVWLFFPLILPFKKRQPRIKTKIEGVISSYNELIEQYNLIQNKNSKLSRSKKKKIIQKINFLVKKGHIKVS